jgi:hypothetical protein
MLFVTKRTNRKWMMDSLGLKMMKVKNISVESKALLEFKSLLILKLIHHSSQIVLRKWKITQFLSQVQMPQSLKGLKMTALKTLNLKLMMKETKRMLKNSQFWLMVSNAKPIQTLSLKYFNLLRKSAATRMESLLRNATGNTRQSSLRSRMLLSDIWSISKMLLRSLLKACSSTSKR